MATVSIRRRANAFIPEATPADLLPAEALAAVERFKRRHGGLWVGGTVFVSDAGVAFKPNLVNRIAHVELAPIDVRADEIRDVRREFGWVTGIVVVRHARGEFRFRCYGAKRLAATMAARFHIRPDARDA